MSSFPPAIPLPPWLRRPATAIVLLSLLAGLAGCSRFRSRSSTEYVYVTVKRMYLRDRVAVVANHVAEVTNGQRLEVVQRIPRFLKVKTPQGAVGWIEDHAVLDSKQYAQFQDLAKQHAAQTPVVGAILYNELYMHIAPGRKTQHFYLLPVNAKVSLLERASVPRYPANSLLGLPAEAKPAKPRPQAGRHPKNFVSQFIPPVRMEDWWLARTADGRTGWMLSRDLDVDVPQVVAQYAENERMIGAYVLRTVDDPDSGKPGGKVPEYVTVLTHYQQGLPYDFDQVRVFTWDTHRHRYGTAFRLRDIVGFFPVKITPGNPNSPNGPEPVFSFRVAPANAVHIDPATGRARADSFQTVTYRMEGNLVHRVLPPGQKPAAPRGRSAQHHARHRSRHTHKHIHR